MARQIQLHHCFCHDKVTNNAYNCQMNTNYERLAEVPEEILRCADTINMPVTWSNQVLESLLKTGLLSRAAISDADLGVRVEGVMLNKVPYSISKSSVSLLLRLVGHQHCLRLRA